MTPIFCLVIKHFSFWKNCQICIFLISEQGYFSVLNVIELALLIVAWNKQIEEPLDQKRLIELVPETLVSDIQNSLTQFAIVRTEMIAEGMKY